MVPAFLFTYLGSTAMRRLRAEQRRSQELLVQSFHLFDESQMVIKTQGIIEVVKT